MHDDVNVNRMLELVATNAAIEDALYHMDKALANSALDLPTFLKARPHNRFLVDAMCVPPG